MNAMFFSAFPDIDITIEDMVAEGDKVVTRYTFRGTHTGDFMASPPPGSEWKWLGSTSSASSRGRSWSGGRSLTRWR